MSNVIESKPRRYRLTKPGEEPEIIVTITGGTWTEMEEKLVVAGASDGLAAAAAEVDGPKWAQSLRRNVHRLNVH